MAIAGCEDGGEDHQPGNAHVPHELEKAGKHIRQYRLEETALQTPSS